VKTVTVLESAEAVTVIAAPVNGVVPSVPLAVLVNV